MKGDFSISFLAHLYGLNIKDPNFETHLPCTADLIEARVRSLLENGHRNKRLPVFSRWAHTIQINWPTLEEPRAKTYLQKRKYVCLYAADLQVISSAPWTAAGVNGTTN